MGLMDDLIENHKPTVRCAVAIIAAQMKPADSKDFMSAVNDGIIPATVISKVLAKRNIRVRATAISYHRRKDCACQQ